jgi:hypothetical protein
MTNASAFDIDERSGTALLGKAAVLIWNDVAEAGRADFYEWHDKEHVPERLSIPGFRRGRRFARPRHSPEWLTMYEADDLAVLTSAAYLARLNAPTPATERTLKHFRNTSRAVCRLVHSLGTSTGGHILAMRLGVASEASDSMCEYLTADAIPGAMALTGIVACHLYAADEGASYVRTAESRTRTFDVPSWVLLCEATFVEAAERARRLFDSTELRSLGVAVGSDAATYALEICRESVLRSGDEPGID